MNFSDRANFLRFATPGEALLEQSTGIVQLTDIYFGAVLPILASDGIRAI